MIARAIVNKPDLILAGGFGHENKLDLFTMLNAEGTTHAVVTHKAEVAEYTNSIIFVRDGKLVQEGKG